MYTVILAWGNVESLDILRELRHNFRTKCKYMGIGAFDGYRTRSSQKATALAAATFRESTWWLMGMRTV